MSEAILAAAVTPRKLEDLIRAALKVTKAEKEFVSVVANELITSEKLHAHPSKKVIDPPLYGSTRYRAPNDRIAVSEALLRAAAVPWKLSALIQEISKATKADKDFVSTVASELIASAQLHDHGKGKLYGLEKPLPPDPFASRKNKTALAKLTEVARKLMAATGVPAEEMLQRLQAALMAPLPTPAQPPAEHPTQPELFSDGVEARSDIMPTVGA